MSSAEERSRGGVCTRLVAMAASVRGEPAGRASEGPLMSRAALPFSLVRGEDASLFF